MKGRLALVCVTLMTLALGGLSYVGAQDGGQDAVELDREACATPLASPFASPFASPMASPFGSPLASPDASPMGTPDGLDECATPGGGTPSS